MARQTGGHGGGKDEALTRRRRKTDSNLSADRKAVTLDPDTWSDVVTALRLTPQQAKIVALILRGHSDKHIAAQLGLCVPTVRTHLARLFQRIGVGDRVELVLSVFAIAQSAWPRDRCHR